MSRDGMELLNAPDRARLLELALCMPDNCDVFGLIADTVVRTTDGGYDPERMRRHLAATCDCVVMQGGGIMYQVWGTEREYIHALHRVGKPIIGMTFHRLPPHYDADHPLLFMAHEHAPESVTFLFRRGWSVALSRWPREPQAQAAYAVAADTPG